MVRILVSVIVFVVFAAVGMAVKGEITVFNVIWSIFVCGGLGVTLVQFLFKGSDEKEDDKK